jgi:hypothetical protein
MAFVKASRSKIYLKLALQGVSGSGKTMSAILLAKGLSENGKIAFIDTENGSGSLYSDRYEYDVDEIRPPFDPAKFSKSFQEALGLGYDVIILDSFSHVWEGVLAIKSELDAKPKANSFTNWNEAGRQFKSVLDTILQSPVHVICCMRRKMDHALDKSDDGKLTVRKLGMAPIMRDNIEYEFSTIFEIDSNHLAYSDKDRTELFIQKPPFKITEDTGRQLKGWLNGNVTESKGNHSFTPYQSSGDLYQFLLDNELDEKAWSLFVSRGWLDKDKRIDEIDPALASKLLKQKDNLILKLKEMEAGK